MEATRSRSGKNKAPGGLPTSHGAPQRRSLMDGRARLANVLPEAEPMDEDRRLLDRRFTENLKARPTWPQLKRCCADLADNWRFAVLTTALTLYALFGDDLRLAAFPKSWDVVFDIFTLISIFIFFVDMLAASIGKEGYFGGFFFWLDVIATLTMFIDVTWISDALFCQDPSGSAIKSGTEAGRQGARASRTVRIIRLIRLVKLYKTYRAAVEKKETEKRKKLALSRTMSSQLSPGELPIDVEEDSEADSETESLEKKPAPLPPPPSVDPETRVGKKLSEMTTRRVIILVLVMLCGMPFMDTETWGGKELPSSANMGAEFIYRRLYTWCTEADGSFWCVNHGIPQTVTSTFTPTEQQLLDRFYFESALLFYLHDHQDGDVAYKLFWLGYQSKHLEDAIGEASAEEYLGQTIAPLNQQQYLGSYATSDCGANWDGMFHNSAWSKDTGALPSSVAQRLCETYTQRCSGYVGVSLASSGGGGTSCSIDEELRCSEYAFFAPLTRADNMTDQLDIVFVFDTRDETRFEAWLSVLQTIFICFAVGIGAMTFASDANQLLLNPIERMIAKMQTIKDHPLDAMRLGDEEYRREQIEAAKRKEVLARKHWLLQLWYKLREKRKTREPMETVILEKTIIKLGGLLARAYGEAGAEVIANMIGNATAGINALVPGQTVNVIIGICSIRSFSDYTDVLRETVMQFVNLVSEIVHGCVDDSSGCPNKNLGGSFLLVWRLSALPREQHSKLADLALLSFVKIVISVSKSSALADYMEHPGLIERVRNFELQLGFGLHCGWAIEGAIGSEFKIDAAYLSPNVTVASMLQKATLPYGVSVLISHFMVQLLSSEMASNCRLIDQCTVKAIRQPVRIYTLDVDPSQIEIEQTSTANQVRNRFEARQIREQRKAEKWSDDFVAAEVFENDIDIRQLRGTFSPEFFQRFWTAFRNYEAGEWLAARDMLYTCHYFIRENVANLGSNVAEEHWPRDGPTKSLLRFMRDKDYEPPAWWQGHRSLPVD